MNVLKVIVLLLTSLSVFAQTQELGIGERPYIEVTGTAEKEIVPDEIYISIRIKERYEGKKKITIEEQEAAFKEALKTIGVSLEDLVLSDANANYAKVKWRKKDVIANVNYLLKVDNAETLGQVFDKLDELKILNANISHTTHTKIVEFRREVRILAIKAAKEKADYLLTAIGEEVGQALEVYDESSKSYDYGAALNVKGSRETGTSYYIDGVKVRGSEPYRTEFKTIKLRASIYVKFGIK